MSWLAELKRSVIRRSEDEERILARKKQIFIIRYFILENDTEKTKMVGLTDFKRKLV